MFAIPFSRFALIVLSQEYRVELLHLKWPNSLKMKIILIKFLLVRIFFLI